LTMTNMDTWDNEAMNLPQHQTNRAWYAIETPQ
jgi:hypothetical protein